MSRRERIHDRTHYESSGARQARYTHGPGIDEPISIFRSGAYYSYHRDALGSVTRITDANRNTVTTYRYDGWGRATTESGTLPNPFRFTGREKNSCTSLYYYRAWTYDPDRGRFAGKDPAGMVDGPNLYAYAGGNPVGRTDPSGRWFEGCQGWECRYGPDPPPSGGSGGGGGGATTGGAGATSGSHASTTSGSGRPIDWGIVGVGIGIVAICIIMIWALWYYGPGLIGVMWEIIQVGMQGGSVELFFLALFGAGLVAFAMLGPCGLGIYFILLGLGITG